MKLFWIGWFIGIGQVLAQSSIPSWQRIAQNALQATVSQYTFDSQTEDFFVVKMSFEEHRVLNKDELLQQPASDILQVDLVYTLFPPEKDFTRLNQNRLKALQEVFPTLFAKSNIQWRYVAQTDCRTREEARDLFHGFVVYYRSFSDFYKLSKPIPPQIEWQNEMPNYRVTSTLEAIVQQCFIPKDSTVFKVLERNALRWKEAIVVSDWTGSMYSHGMQVLVWMALYTQEKEKLKHFIFFNDGDAKAFGEKVIGQTGGIYKAPSCHLSAIISTMRQAQKGGEGGYNEENDIEALLQAQTLCIDCQDIVLIADSRSYARDLVLLPTLAARCRRNQQKLRIILCGAQEQIVADYIHMAYYTDGSLHTLREDILDMSRLHTKEGICLAGRTYLLNKEGYLVPGRKKKKNKRK